MKLFSMLRRDKAWDDEPLDEQRADLLRIPAFRDGLTIVQESCDELHGVHGPFGTVATNPIPVNGVIGEIVYINQLRWENRIGFLFHRLGTVTSPICEHRLDVYELVTIDASHWTILYFSPYHPRRSSKSPSGTVLMPWSKMDDSIRMGIKLTLFGTNYYVDDFPFGLPDDLAAHSTVRVLSPGLENTFANRVRAMISRNEGKWMRPYVLPSVDVVRRP